MEKSCRFSYSDFEDSFIVSCKEENENIKESFLLDDIVFYLTGRGKIVGLQIRNASQFLTQMNFNPEILSQVKAVSMMITIGQNSLLMGLKFVALNNEQQIPLGRIFMPQL